MLVDLESPVYGNRRLRLAALVSKTCSSKPNTEDILDTRGTEAKNKLFAQKERDWLKFGYTQEYLDSMKKMAFWDNEYAKIHHYDDLIVQAEDESDEQDLSSGPNSIRPI
ncbi:MAG: hypothetical protein MZU97_20740 [Bacillus subtilis]|nr:hypothetical protein [Bacillus subtilis]